MNLENNRAIDSKMRKVLQQVMQLDFLNDYCLVGGTNLALRYQHRKSVDLDFFRYHRDFKNAQLETEILFNNLMEIFPSIKERDYSITNVGIFSYIDGIKVDFVNYPYPFIDKIENYNGIRMASELDIASMKINAIIGRGSKKDFYDLHELLKRFDLSEIIETFSKKYNGKNIELVKRSLLYFQDAENKKDINNYVESFLRETWQEIKKNIERKYIQYEKVNHK